MEDVTFDFRGHSWKLSAGRAIYWEQEQLLIVADLHVGKSAHFRKAGIAVPANIVQEDLYRLQQLITQYLPQRVIVVGDMFHSSANNDVQYFRIWRQQFPHITFDLITGNHDIMEAAVYTSLDIRQHDFLEIQDIYFIHDAENKPATLKNSYVLSGHIHPGVRLVGYGRQSLRLPCFYFGEEVAILPAFSGFTGTYALEREAAAEVFVIAEKKVLRV